MAQAIVSEYHDLLFPIAYNLLGSVSDAEDLVQETMLKWLSVDQASIDNPRGYLVRMLVNRGLNMLRDRQRERVEGIQDTAISDTWAETPSPHMELGPSLSLGVQAMMAKLTPMERAVFLLKEVFHFSHKELAEILDISEAYCRQILRRARTHLRDETARFEVDPRHHLQLYRTFIEVCQGEDLGQLLELLKEDIELDIARPAAVAQLVSGRSAVASWLHHQHDSGLRYELQWMSQFPRIVVTLLGKPLRHLRLWGDGQYIRRIQVQELASDSILVPA